MLTILYRACNKELEYPPQRTARPSWFSKINCFNSLHQSILNSKYKDDIRLIVNMDGDKSNLSDFIEGLGYDIIYNKFYSGPKSYIYQLNYAENEMHDSDIYFLEDDYLHTLDAIDHMYLAIPRFGLVTGYDHLDRYTRTDDISNNKESLFFYNNRHWRTAESTTLTWAVSQKFKQIVLDYNKKWQKNNNWVDREMFRDMYHYGIRLHQPIPAIASHIHSPFLSPGIDWEFINNKNIVL